MDYSHIIMVRNRELLMERCSPKEMEAMAATAPATRGGPLPPFFLGLGATMEDPLPFLAAPKREANSWLLVALPKLGFFSPYMCLCGALWPSDGWTLDPMALGNL